MLLTVTQSMDEMNELFPAVGEEGTDVIVSPDAQMLAEGMLQEAGVKVNGAFEWHTPNVFDVRYGSSYVATAKYEGHSVRFLMEEGDFREGDDS